MSANSKIDLASASSTTKPTQAESIRSAMSFDKILVQPTTTLEMTEASMLDAPSTPPKSLNEETSSPVAPSDIAMTEPAELDTIPEEFLEDGEDVPDSQREFICMNDEHSRCQTGQYTKDLSRKVISDHFGRNKACTRDITDWPLFCRKHYQRATYSKAKWQIRKIQLIFRQLDVIEKQFPGTTYDIAFKKSEEARLNQYSRYVAAGMSNEEAEQRVAPVAGKNFEAPIDVLRELDQCLGGRKSYEEVKEIVDVILQMLEAHECEQVPSIEFLPQLPAKYATPTKTPVKARTAKSPKSPNTPSRVSDKGAVKKTSRDV